MRIPVARLFVLAASLALALAFAGLCVGCDDEKQQQTAIAANIQTGNALVTQWRAAALAMPDTDSRKLPFLNAIADMDTAIKKGENVLVGTKEAQAQPPPTDALAPIASLVPWGSAALLGIGAVYKTVQEYQRSGEVKAANKEIADKTATARSFAYAIDAHNVNSPVDKQIVSLHPEAVAQLTPEAVKILNNDNLTVDSITKPVT